MAERGVRDLNINAIDEDDVQSDLKEAFNVFDEDHDSYVTVQEIDRVLRGLGKNYTTQQINKMVAKIDKDGDGRMDFDEFVTMMSTVYRPKKQGVDELKDAFDVFDEDGNGSISAEELTRIMAVVGEQIDENTIKEMIQEVDTDGDGNIDYQEFRQLMLREGPRINPDLYGI